MYLNQIQKLIAREVQDHPVRVYLFGSRADGPVRTGSDCDIGIDPMHRLPEGFLSRLRETLEESHIPYSCDLIDLSQVSREFADGIREKGVLWIDTSQK